MALAWTDSSALAPLATAVADCRQRPDRIACPLTGDRRVTVLEEIPTSLLIDLFRRDLGLDVGGVFGGLEQLQLCHSAASDLLFFHPAVTGSPVFYDALRRFAWYDQDEKLEHARAACWIAPRERVLDIGCGPGTFAGHVPRADYQGLERGRAADLARQKGLAIDGSSLAAHSVKQAESYDAACAFQVLEHVAEPRRFLTDALRCLKPGGLLILAVPSAESYLAAMTNLTLNAPPHHVTWWSDRALTALTETFALKLLALEGLPLEPWESRLYWMQRIADRLAFRPQPRFSPARRWRILTPLTYVLAGIRSRIGPLPSAVRGASTLLVARKAS